MNDKKLVDKGFELAYYNLSYRRRFIRTLWMFPWLIVAMLVLLLTGVSKSNVVIYGVFVIIIFIVQATHNYKLWKEEEQFQQDQN